jgi:hypothetical protein
MLCPSWSIFISWLFFLGCPTYLASNLSQSFLLQISKEQSRPSLAFRILLYLHPLPEWAPLLSKIKCHLYFEDLKFVFQHALLSWVPHSCIWLSASQLSLDG